MSRGLILTYFLTKTLCVYGAKPSNRAFNTNRVDNLSNSYK